jgi:hypothetical protein
LKSISSRPVAEAENSIRDTLKHASETKHSWFVQDTSVVVFCFRPMMFTVSVKGVIYLDNIASALCDDVQSSIMEKEGGGVKGVLRLATVAFALCVPVCVV